jgi:hypothetical protein
MDSTAKKVFLSFFALMSNTVIAQTIETNIAGLVIKDYKCNASISNVNGNLINRNSEPFNGALRVKIIDKENDIIWQGTTKITVGHQNGIYFQVFLGVGTCLSPNKVQITLER